MQTLDIPDASGFSAFLSRLLLLDTSLLNVLLEASTAMVAGQARNVLHLPATPPPTPPIHSSPSSSQWRQPPAAPLRIQSCYSRQPDGTLEPSLLIEYVVLHADSSPASPRPTTWLGRQLEASRLGTSNRVSNRAASGRGSASAPTSPMVSALWRQPCPATPSSITIVAARAASHSAVAFTPNGGSYTGSSMPVTPGRLTTTPFAGFAAGNFSSSGLGAPELTDMMRGAAVLAHCPLATLLDLDGRVVYQNAGSKVYWGPLAVATAALAATTPSVTSMQMLEHLFSLAPQWLEPALADLKAGRKWQRVVQVPASSKSEMRRLRNAKGQALQAQIQQQRTQPHQHHSPTRPPRGGPLMEDRAVPIPPPRSSLAAGAAGDLREVASASPRSL